MFSLEDFEELTALLNAYKAEIGEDTLGKAQIAALHGAIAQGGIRFFVAKEGETLAAMCSVCLVFSTYQCAPCGIFEDFYIAPAFRGKGTARGLTCFVFAQCRAAGVASLWVGAAESLTGMYRSLGFDIPLGSLLCRNFS